MLPGMLKEGGRTATRSGRMAMVGRGAMGGRMGMTGGIRAAAGSAMTTGATRLAFLANPYVGLAATAASIGAGYYYGSESGEEDPWEKSVGKRRGVAGKKIEKAQGFFGAAEAFTSGATGLVSNYETLTGPQRSEQFKGLSKAFSNMLPEIPEDREDEVREAYINLKKSLLSGEGMFEAEQKLSKTLHKVAQAMDQLREESEGLSDALDIEEAAAKFSGISGSSQSQRNAGAMVGRESISHNFPVYPSTMQGLDPFSSHFDPIGAVGAAILGHEALGFDKPGRPLSPIGTTQMINEKTGLPFTDIEAGFQPSGAEVLLKPGKEFADLGADFLKGRTSEAIRSLAQQVAGDVPSGAQGPKKEGQFESDRLFRAKWAQEKGMFLSKKDSPGGIDFEVARKEFRIQQKIAALKKKGLKGLEDLTITDFEGSRLPVFGKGAGGGALRELTSSGDAGTGYHPLIQERAMDQFMKGISSGQVQLFNTLQAVAPERKDRVPLIQEFLKIQRDARIRGVGRKEHMRLFTQDQAATETTRAGKASLAVKLAAAQGGEWAGLEAQREADIAKAAADRDQAIDAAREKERLKREAVQDIFAKSLGETGVSKKFLDALPTDMENPKASAIVTKQFEELKKLFDPSKPMTVEALQKIDKTIGEMSEGVRDLGASEGAATLTKRLEALRLASKEAEEGMLDLSNTETGAQEVYEKLVPHIREMSAETIKVNKALKLFSAAAMNVSRLENVRVAKSKVEALKGVKGVTGAEQAAAATQLRRAEIAAGGGFQGLGGLTGAFKYNANDAALEFEEGMVDVGNTIKSSLKTAIKNIVSGADSFDDAMFNVFATLADKLADQGISMGVNSLFGMFGGSKGGMVPRGYNQGGMVRGGSGTRDDVLTYMQGGEYVIRKSAVNQIPGGEATLNAINGGNARGGFIPGYGGGGRANVSLAKEFLFNDPKRPTSGGYNISGALSTSGLFREDDPQTANTIGKQAKFVRYQSYRQREQQRRDKIIEDIERQKKGRLYNAYLSAALRIGAGALNTPTTPASTGGGGDPSGWEGYGAGASSTSAGTYPTRTPLWGGTDGGSASGGYIPGFASGGPARVMGGEYVMSPGATAQHGTAFMSQLNRGRLPGFQDGGLVGGGGAAMAAGITTNNVNLSINVDKSGGTTVSTEKSGKDRNKNDERSTSEEAEDSKKLAEGIRNAVLKEIITQQRPGGLLRDGASASGLRTGR
jgi:hypothetical protein